ncbi:unnamed protein product, partial [Allacma fusca]
RSDNFQAFMTQLGMPEERLQLYDIKKWHVAVSYNKQTETWSMNIAASVPKNSLVFKLGQPFKETSLDAQECTSTITASPESNTTWNYRQTCGERV